MDQFTSEKRNQLPDKCFIRILVKVKMSDTQSNKGLKEMDLLILNPDIFSHL